MKPQEEELLDGDYEIVDPDKEDVILFADFGRRGLERSTEKIRKIKNTQKLCAYGVLGSVRGISILIRNVLAFENIRNIYLIGNDIKPFFSFTAMELLVKNGIDENKRIIGFREYIKSKYDMYPIIDNVELDNKIINWFRKYIRVIRMSSLEEYDSNVKVKRNESMKVDAERKKIAYKIRKLNKEENTSKKTLKPKSFDVMVGTHIYEETIEEAHKLAMLHILFSGHETASQYGKTKEIINMMITVKDPYEEVLSNSLYLEYGKDLISPQLKSDTYTYGRLLCSYNGFNQIENIINRLEKNLEDRACVASLWMPSIHLTQETEQPCLNLVHVLLRNNKINITAYIRSNDMYKAWPTNVAGLSYINYHIWSRLSEKYEDLKLGYVTTISGSAHIYESDWNDALKIALTYEKDFVQDKFGYFILSMENGKYVAKIYENNGNMIGVLEDECPVRLRKTLVRYFAITPEHASYIGEELKALNKLKEK